MAGGNWRMIDLPPEFLNLWREQSPDVEAPRCFQNPGGLTAMIGREPFDNAGEDIRWHISVRYGDRGVNGRIPTWGELVNAAHELRPGVVFVLGIPPRSWWMSVHPDVLHLHETRDEPLIQMYRDNAMGSVPS